jgi:hypothetical protein
VARLLTEVQAAESELTASLEQARTAELQAQQAVEERHAADHTTAVQEGEQAAAEQQQSQQEMAVALSPVDTCIMDLCQVGYSSVQQVVSVPFDCVQMHVGVVQEVAFVGDQDGQDEFFLFERMDVTTRTSAAVVEGAGIPTLYNKCAVSAYFSDHAHCRRDSERAAQTISWRFIASPEQRVPAQRGGS